jgi:PiT family inorganic phosphate transporter
MELFLVSIVIFLGLLFTYTNGFHDTANAIATVVGTKVLTPRQAIMLAAVTNLLGAFFGLAVAKTISSGIVDSAYITQPVLICVLLSAIFWNLLTWWYGIPSSSTHALVGSLIGAALGAAVCINAAKPLADKEGKPVSVWSAMKWVEVKPKKEKKLSIAEPSLEVLAALGDKRNVNGTHTVTIGTNKVMLVAFEGRVREVVEKEKIDKAGVYYKVVIPMIFSPLVGFSAGLIIMALLYAVLRGWRPVSVNRVFGKLQLASSAYMGFSHGMNDATKCMGIITLALVAATKGGMFTNVPDWMAFLRTTEGSDALSLGIGDHFISWLPGWLQMGYMPAPVDVKSQGVPAWVVVVCALTMGAGTAAGGWKIIKTMGHKMVKLQPVHGFAAETTAATVLAVTGSLGMPVSTTHAITTSIMGVGCAKRFSALKLKVIEKILWAWILTIPATAGVAYALVWGMNKFGWINF